MQERLLNRTATIYRKDVTSGGLTDTGDFKKSTDIKVDSNTKIRITKNLPEDKESLSMATNWMAAMWLGFVLPAADIKINDTVEDNASGYRYTVAWVDEIPGGANDSHKEVYLNDSRNE